MSGTGGLSKSDQVLLEAAQDVARTKDDLVGDIANLRGKLQNLQGQWEGRGGAAFQGAINAWQNTADRVLGAMDNFKAELEGTEGTYNEAEDIVANTLNKYQDGRLG